VSVLLQTGEHFPKPTLARYEGSASSGLIVFGQSFQFLLNCTFKLENSWQPRRETSSIVFPVMSFLAKK